jgi:hypothetical protein
MTHRATSVLLLLIACNALAALGPAGCLLGTDDEPEDAGVLGADTLGLDLLPGFTEEGIDPPSDTDTGPANNLFAGYDCESSSYYDDVCEYYVCQVKSSWDMLVEECGQGEYPATSCEFYLACLAAYVHCIEDHCDGEGDIGSSDLSQCSDALIDCYSY